MRKAILIFMVLFLTASFAMAGGGRQAAPYPSRPVTIIVPLDVGGGTDIIARALLTVMGNHFPQPMVVVNRPGGGTVLGTMEFIRSRPDGYTITINGWMTYVTLPHLTEVPFTPDDYIPIARLNHMPRILSANLDAPFNTLHEMITYARANPNGINVGIGVVGDTAHLMFGELEIAHGVSFNFVPMGGGALIAGVLGGHVHVAAPNTAEIGAQVLAGQVRPLAMMAEERHPDFPDIMTSFEMGIPVEGSTEAYVLAPRGTPPEILQKLEETFRNVVADPDLRPLAQRLNLGLNFLGSADAARRLQESYERFGYLIRRMGIGI